MNILRYIIFPSLFILFPDSKVVNPSNLVISRGLSVSSSIDAPGMPISSSSRFEGCCLSNLLENSRGLRYLLHRLKVHVCRLVSLRCALLGSEGPWLSGTSPRCALTMSSRPTSTGLESPCPDFPSINNPLVVCNSPAGLSVLCSTLLVGLSLLCSVLLVGLSVL